MCMCRPCACVCVYSKWCVCVLCGIQLCVCAAAFCNMYVSCMRVCLYVHILCIYMHMCVHAVQFKQVCHKNACGTCRACSFLRMCMCACARVCMYVCTTTTQRNVTLHHVMQCNVMIFNSMSKSRLGQRKHEEMFLLPKKTEKQ